MPVAAWIALVGLALGLAGQGMLIAFFLGKQSQRIATLEREANREAGLSEKVTRLQVQNENMAEQMKSMDRHLQNMARQLANLATKGGFQPAMTDHA
ncbi:hypothetical protein [Caulobacter sp. NIBR2454]|uniref:hypothetical protein n=1 Tax=Caulobacter sp. NIBR2454 TaxID=3015996 RepID=UPI0022B63945|nr:hypothetical protein [Caulobacter sp. NIBR2454]